MTTTKPITHQDIIDRMEALDKEHGEAYKLEQARIGAERTSLRELCGGLGHTFAISRWPGAWNTRCCVFCSQVER